MKRILIYFTFLFVFYSCHKDDQPHTNTTTIATKPSSASSSETKIVVRNADNYLQAGATVKLFHSVDDLIGDVNAYNIFQSDYKGEVILTGSMDVKIICKATKNGLSSEFIQTDYYPVLQPQLFLYKVFIDSLTSDQRIGGHNTKKWVMVEYKENGVVQSNSLSLIFNLFDSTWSDNNSNIGTWHFASNNTQLVFNYTGSGQTLSYDIINLTADSLSLTNTQGTTIVEMNLAPFH